MVEFFCFSHKFEKIFLQSIAVLLHLLLTFSRISDNCFTLEFFESFIILAKFKIWIKVSPYDFRFFFNFEVFWDQLGLSQKFEETFKVVSILTFLMSILIVTNFLSCVSKCCSRLFCTFYYDLWQNQDYLLESSTIIKLTPK